MSADDRIGMAEASEILGLEPYLVLHRMDSGVLAASGSGSTRIMLRSDVLALKARDAEFDEIMVELYAAGLDVEDGTVR